MSVILRLAANAVAIVLVALALPACDTLAPILAPVLGPPQDACEPLTGQTYTVRLKDGAGTVARAAAPNPRCQISASAARAAAQKLQGKILYLVSTCQLGAAGWDEARQQGGVLFSSELMPGCVPPPG